MKIRLLITSLRIPELFREKSVFIDGTQIYMPTNKSKLCCHMSSTLRLNTAKPSCVGVTELGLTPSYNLSERVFSPRIRKELIMSTDVDQVKHLNGNNYKMIKGSSFFADINKQLGLLPGFKGLGQDISKLDQETQTPGSTTPMDKVRQTAEVIASDVISTFGGQDNEKKPPNRYCKTMRRTVRELSDRHDIAFKGMVQKLNVNDTNAFPTFVSVVDEIFEDGQINWGRIVAVYTFASRLAFHCRKHSPDCDERIALYAGKYVASKLGKWILDNGGWDAFADYFPEQGAMEDKLWKGLMFTAVGLGALATMVAAR